MLSSSVSKRRSQKTAGSIAAKAGCRRHQRGPHCRTGGTGRPRTWGVTPPPLGPPRRCMLVTCPRSPAPVSRAHNTAWSWRLARSSPVCQPTTRERVDQSDIRLSTSRSHFSADRLGRPPRSQPFCPPPPARPQHQPFRCSVSQPPISSDDGPTGVCCCRSRGVNGARVASNRKPVARAGRGAPVDRPSAGTRVAASSSSHWDPVEPPANKFPATGPWALASQQRRKPPARSSAPYDETTARR